MIVSGPTTATVVPAVTAAQVQIFQIWFDMTAHTFQIFYGVSGQPAQVLTGATPAAILTALQAKAQSAIETAQGWAANSSTLVSP